MRAKSDATEILKTFLGDIRADGTPSAVECDRSDGGGEFHANDPFGKLCRDRGIRQEQTTANTPERNTVAESAISLVESAAPADRLHASESYPNLDVPDSKSIYAEGLSWATDDLNRCWTTANPGNRSQYEMWFGKPAPVKILPFLKLGFLKQKHDNKLQPKAQKCFSLGPVTNHVSDAYGVILKNGSVIATRNITWRHVPSHAGEPVPAVTLAVAESSGEGGEIIP